MVEDALQPTKNLCQFLCQFGRGGNNNPIKSVPIDIVADFWTVQAFRGNTKAQALVAACMKEALQRRCDTAFNNSSFVNHNDNEYL